MITTNEIPPIDPRAMEHFMAIQAALSEDEASNLRRIMVKLAPLGMRAWLAELAALSIPDAITRLRSLDERDREIRITRAASLAANPINPGEFVVYRDGTVRRVAYVWTNEDGTPWRVQTCTDGSFYLGDGYVSMSGSLFPGVPFEQLTPTDERRDGRVWFFHNDYARAHNGVDVEIPLRVWRIDANPED